MRARPEHLGNFEADREDAKDKENQLRQRNKYSTTVA